MNLIFVLVGRVIISRFFDHLVNGRSVGRWTFVFWLFVVVNLFVMFVTFRFRCNATVFFLAALLQFSQSNSMMKCASNRKTTTCFTDFTAKGILKFGAQKTKTNSTFS